MSVTPICRRCHGSAEPLGALFVPLDQSYGHDRLCVPCTIDVQVFITRPAVPALEEQLDEAEAAFEAAVPVSSPSSRVENQEAGEPRTLNAILGAVFASHPGDVLAPAQLVVMAKAAGWGTKSANPGAVVSVACADLVATGDVVKLGRGQFRHHAGGDVVPIVAVDEDPGDDDEVDDTPDLTLVEDLEDAVQLEPEPEVEAEPVSPYTCATCSAPVVVVWPSARMSRLVHQEGRRLSCSGFDGFAKARPEELGAIMAEADIDDDEDLDE